MGGELKYIYCFLCSFQNLFKTFRNVYVCTSHLTFSTIVSFVSWWCNHTIVVTQLQHGRIPVSFLLNRSDFSMIDYLSIAVHSFPMHILTSLSVDEISLPRYVNCSTNVRMFNVEIAPSFSKHLNSVLSEFTLLPDPCYAERIGLG